MQQRESIFVIIIIIIIITIVQRRDGVNYFTQFNLNSLNFMFDCDRHVFVEMSVYERLVLLDNERTEMLNGAYGARNLTIRVSTRISRWQSR